MVIHFLNPATLRGPETSLLLQKEEKFHLDQLTSHSMFHSTSDNYFITIQLQSSIWQPQNASLHSLRISDDLISKDPTHIPLENA